MEKYFTAKNRKYVTIGLILLFSIISLGIRLLPLSTVSHAWGVAVYENDPWYTLRQIETMVAGYPGYNWFDPMTAYPYGKIVDWGPLFPFIAATACLIAGATTRPEIMVISSYIPPLLAAFMVPVMFLVGRTFSDWKTGILAALLIAIVPGQFLYKSLFGYVDHHVAEVLFSTLFCLGYIATLRFSRLHPMDFRQVETLGIPVVFAGATGIFYLLGLFTMPTMILFALIVTIFTAMQGLVDTASGRTSEYLLLLNGITFGIGIIGILILGIPHQGLSLSQYSVGHVYAYVFLIATTAAVALLTRVFNNRPVYYGLSLAGIAAASISVIAFASPTVFNTFTTGASTFFTSSSEVLTIVEARPWTLDQAWFSYQTGLLLMAGGIGLLALQVFRNRHPERLFIIVWSLVILFATWSHWRYEYYLSVNVALLSAILVGGVLTYGWGDLKKVFSSRAEESSRGQDARKKEQKAKRTKTQTRHSKTDPMKVMAISGTLLLLVVFGAYAIQYDYQSASHAYTTSISDSWYETLTWVSANTPDPGADYLGRFSRNEFKYPAGSYGILSWWDYGHWITYLAKRIPNTNPFQDNAGGSKGVAAFFMAESEESALKMLQNLGSRYVITDTAMAGPLRFPTIAEWYNSSMGVSSYIREFLSQDPTAPGSYKVTSLGTEQYYNTMVARLQDFDGSMATPTDALYIEFRIDPAVDANRPILTRSASMPLADATEAANRYNSKAAPGYHAAVVSGSLNKPLSTVPALAHFRLIYESSSGSTSTVKVFEYVAGARAKGDGTIELNLTAPTGRTFTYRQESRNGEFVLPYSTVGNPYEVKAIGKYRILGTDREFDVTEEQVQAGDIIR